MAGVVLAARHLARHPLPTNKSLQNICNEIDHRWPSLWICIMIDDTLERLGLAYAGTLHL